MRRTANPALLVPDATVVTPGDGTNHVLLLRRLWACVLLRASNWTAGVICGRIVVSWESRRVGVWERNGGGAEEVCVSLSRPRDKAWPPSQGWSTEVHARNRNPCGGRHTVLGCAVTTL